MALNSNDQSHFTREESVVSESTLLNTPNSLFPNVNLNPHLPNYGIDAYNQQNTNIFLRNFQRPDLPLPHGYPLAAPNHSGNNHIADGGDFVPRPGVSHGSNPVENNMHDIYGDRNQSSAGHVVRTRRRKAGGEDGSARLCVVCKEPASGYNFDRLTCESCKAFFRRNALKPREKIKQCSRNGDCDVVGSQRKHCPSCRLEKCLAVGMKKELILPPEKLEQRAKPKRRRQNANVDEPGNSGSGPPGLMSFGPGGPAGFPQPNAFHTNPAQAAGLVGSRVPQSQFGPAEAHDFMTSRNLNNLFNDMASLRGAGGQINPLDPTSMKLHFSMGAGGNGASGIPPEPSFDHSSSMATFQRGLPPSASNEGGNQFTGRPPLPPPTPSRIQTGAAPTPRSFLDESSFAQPLSSISNLTGNSSGLVGPQLCRRADFKGRCFHVACRRIAARRQFPLCEPTNLEPDKTLLNCLNECVLRIREPFSPDEHLETKAAVTLEQEYNRMDICIRRIIRVIKMLPCFNDIGKPIQLGLLRANIYGMIVLYSSFFFEPNIRKLRYPVKDRNGALSSVTVSMLDDIPTPEDENAFPSPTNVNINRLKEDFELYKSNTMAAFNHLEELAGTDDVLRMALLAIKLFSDDSVDENFQSIVASSRSVYIYFLWTYLRWRAGPHHLNEAYKLFHRFHIAFLDLRSLEIRMTEFAKLVSLDGLSPLMREICSSNSGGSTSGSVGTMASSISENARPISSGTLA